MLRKLLPPAVLLLSVAAVADVAPLEYAYEYDFTVTEVGSIYALVNYHSGPHEEFGPRLEEALAALEGSDIELIGAPFGVYLDDPSTAPADELQWLIGLPVVPGTPAPAAFDESRELEGGTIVTTTLYGELDFESLDVYGELYRYIAENGYEVAGPLVEIYDWHPARDPAGWATDFFVFIETAED